jgi:L-alanine-DL-glutamate epimerase-like enolase superfamily enzyme
VRIAEIEPFILHVPVTNARIEDSTHGITHWGAAGVVLRTDTGLQGYGYTWTHAHLASDRLITSCIRDVYGPLLLGEDPRDVQRLWNKLCHYPPVQWVGRAGITHLAAAAVDVALWDLKAKSVEQPLWKLLGGATYDHLEAYNTDGGWLNWSLDELVADAKRMTGEAGFRGIKIKVGSPEPGRDERRIEEVRAAIGPSVKLMVDANGKWSLPAALQMGRALSENDVFWLEEPCWYDDLEGHAALARSLRTPIALGEQLYSLHAFRSFIQAGAVHFVQPGVVRLAGITEWLRVADLAHANRLPVAPHIGDMMQIHVHLAFAHPACSCLEYIPWLRECFVEPATVKDGEFVLPQCPGAGTTLREDALSRFGRAV